MQDRPLFSEIDLGVLPALEAWAAHASVRGKTMQDTMKKAMRFAIDFAIAKTRKGNREKTMADLSKLLVTYKLTKKHSKSKAAEKWRGTIAAAIVWRLNYQNAQTLAVNHSPAFYTTVAKFVNGRAYATNLHAAGWKPAQRALRGASAGVRLPSFRNHPPGSIPKISLSENLAEILVENYASAAPVPERPAPMGIQGILGERINEILPDLERLFTEFLAEDIMLAAKEAGFGWSELQAAKKAARQS